MDGERERPWENEDVVDLANQLDISWYDIRVRLEMGYDPQMLMDLMGIGRPGGAPFSNRSISTIN